MDATLVGPTGRTTLGAAIVTIGRAPDNQLVLSNDPKVSSHHAEIHPDGQYHTIVDLGSTNHTFVNEQDLYRNLPRRLQAGDVIRIGDTVFNYEVSSPQQSPPYVSDGSTMRAADPGQFGGGTSYGLGPDAETFLKPQGLSYSSPPQEYIAPQSQEYIAPVASQSAQPVQPQQMPQASQPAQSAYPAMSQPGQFAQSYDPTAYSYQTPATQQAPQTQQPMYQPGQYGNGGTQNAMGSYAPGVPQLSQQPSQPPQRRRSLSVMVIVLVALALLVVIGSAGALYVVHNNQVATSNSQATSTAVTKVTATQLAHEHATATFTAEFRNPYAPNTGTLALLDPLTNTNNVATFRWDQSTNCKFQSNGYHVNENQQKTFFPCQAHAKQFTNFAYQATMTITSGDCGGLLFRSDDKGTNLYLYEVCNDGTYAFIKFTGNSATTIFSPSSASSLIHAGLNQANVLAVVATGNTMQFYANHQLLTSQSDTSLSSGEIGMLSINLSSSLTDVAYQDARVWAL